MLVSISFWVVLTLAACGGSSDPPGQPAEVVWRKGEPVAVVHRGPVPKKLIVKDLRPGSGAVLKKGKTMKVKFRSFDYRTGTRYENWWD